MVQVLHRQSSSGQSYDYGDIRTKQTTPISKEIRRKWRSGRDEEKVQPNGIPTTAVFYRAIFKNRKCQKDAYW